MDIDQIESLQRLVDEIEIFIEAVDEEDHHVEDNEYKFLEDESGISNTELDNLVESLNNVQELARRFIA
jgi:hypothetical protein